MGNSSTREYTKPEQKHRSIEEIKERKKENFSFHIKWGESYEREGDWESTLREYNFAGRYISCDEDYDVIDTKIRIVLQKRKEEEIKRNN